MDFQGDDSPPRRSSEASSNDRYFLLSFVMSTYLGPDVFSDNPRCSASQRLAMGLPPYSSKNLGNSFVSISQLESLYYYVLKNAHPSLILKPNDLYKYLKGNLLLPRSGLLGNFRQFTSYFPLNLHEHKRYSGSYEIVKGIVIVNDPVTSYMIKEELERFKCLSGMDNLEIDKIISLCYQHGYDKGKEKGEQNGITASEEIISEDICNRNSNSSAKFQEIYNRTQNCGHLPLQAFPRMTPVSNRYIVEGALQRNCESDEPTMMPLMTLPRLEDCVSDTSIVLGGTAAQCIAGPPVGVMDIGISKTAYFFRASLPGVRRDYSEFSCEIEPDGKVHIKGSTTGGKTVKKRSRVFQMKFQQLCPPGPFTLTFSLPGPVDPRLFSPTFRSDGVFEGVIIKL
ncbi:hypothetical protein CFOL_v3_09350 [Cephalotus follicularis]|uniref:SHSP domain-containing protein n=1 Tax=Cephalotus follicularis TaxID=3775 RepID=A0A1Q3BCS4_CEPFO|nr:hypothetical protein CFOL_v3_09350 [Cephalotus follicularis]